MQKDAWTHFVTEKLQHQLLAENSKKIQTAAIALLGLFSLGAAINLLSMAPGKTFLLVTKILFLIYFHLIMVLGIYLPDHLQRGEKTISRLLGMRDQTSLVFVSLTLAGMAYVVFSISQQVLADSADARASGFLTTMAWCNAIVTGFYLAASVFYLVGSKCFPKTVSKIFEKLGGKSFGFLIAHSVLFVLSLWAYSQVVEIGTASFFEQFRLAGLFWIFCASLVLLPGRCLEESQASALGALELEVASGKLERTDDILARYKQVFVSKRLMVWLNRRHHVLAAKAHEIAQYLHESVSIVEQEKPTEPQLATMEDRYRKALQTCRKLDKDYQAFLVNLSFLTLADIEREKIEALQDRFSKEIRHGKLELDSVRKRIDDKLHALKDRDREQLSEISVQPEKPAVEKPQTPASTR